MNATTASRGSRILGGVALASLVALALFGLVFSPADSDQGDLVRIMYLHVPAAVTGYLAVFTCGLGSVLWLWKKSRWWDLVAASAAEVSIAFIALCLLTGSLWGRQTWGTYWDWDPRITTTTLLLLLVFGYVAVRRLGGDPASRNTRSAVLGILAVADIPIVHKAVDWWRGLHQGATISRTDQTAADLHLFSVYLGMVAFVLTFAWLLLHRFRVAWLEEQVEEQWLDEAVGERRAEAVTR